MSIEVKYHWKEFQVNEKKYKQNNESSINQREKIERDKLSTLIHYCIWNGLKL